LDGFYNPVRENTTMGIKEYIGMAYMDTWKGSRLVFADILLGVHKHYGLQEPPDTTCQIEGFYIDGNKLHEVWDEIYIDGNENINEVLANSDKKGAKIVNGFDRMVREVVEANRADRLQRQQDIENTK